MEFRTMRATCLSVADYNTTLSTDSLETGTGSSNSLRSANESRTLRILRKNEANCRTVYLEAARLLVSGGSFLLIGYHPFFLMNGTPTHYHRTDGVAVTIQSYVHLFSEHYQAGNNGGLTLLEFQERVIDEDWLLSKPKWQE